MPTLSTKFRLEDEISSRLDAISSSGERMLNQWDNTRASAEKAMTSLETSASSVSSCVNSAAASIEDAAGRTYHWTDAIGTYDKSAMLAINSIDELVKSGYLQADALGEAAKQTENATNAVDKGTSVMNEFRSAIEEQEKELSNLQEAYMGLVLLEGDNSEAAKKLKGEIDDLSKTLDDNKKEVDDLEKKSGKAGETVLDAIKEVEAALVAAGITKMLGDMAEAAYELATAFSEAESIIVKATGASGAALDSLNASMMDAFAASKTGGMDDAAAAVGELNTRMGLYGDELTDVTEKFLDFSSATGNDVASSVQQVTKLMNRWNVENKDVGITLDKLTYAGQVTGVSVSSLSSQLQSNASVLQQFDLSLDNSIMLLSELDMAGANTSMVITGLRTAAKNFAEDGLDAHDALIDTIRRLELMEDQAAATALATEIFGARAGQELVKNIQDGTLSVEAFSASLEDTEGTLAKTAEGAQTLSEKWEQASNSMNAAFTQAVGPTIDNLSSALAGVVNGIGKFLKEHEALAKVLAAVAFGLGTVVAGIVGITVVTKVIPLIKTLALSFTSTQMAILGVVGAAATLVAIVAFANDGTSAFEEERRAAEALNEEISGLATTHDQVISSYNKTNAEIETQYESSQRLIARLKELDSTAEKTAGTEAEMKTIVDKLNEAYPQLGVTLDDVSGSLDTVIAKFEQAAGAESKVAKYENAKAHYDDLLAEQEELEKAWDKAQRNLSAVNAEYANYNMGDAFADTFLGGSDRTKVFNEAQRAYDEAYRLYSENQKALKECRDEIESYGELVSGSSEEQVSAYDAVYISLNKVQDATTQLITRYNESYQAAYDSISGSMGLFEQMAISCETSTEQMIAALKSQSDYMTTYTENLKLAAEYGLNEGLIASLSDGSKESAGYLEAIISKIDELGGHTTAANDFVREMNGAFHETEKAKDEFATTVADMQTDFDSEMKKITTTMEKTISDMNMDTEAAKAAKATLDAYVEMIKSYKGTATDAAAAVAAATSTALAGAFAPPSGTTYVPQKPNFDIAPYPGHASGTLSAESAFIAGENGPELVLDHAGSTVFPTGETDRLIHAINDSFNISPAEYTAQAGGGSGSAPAPTEKKITLELAGSGSINISGGANKESILEMMTENLKPVLLQIIETEIMEEGDGTYDY